MVYLTFIIVAYIFGAIPCGVWIGKKAKNIDIREYGSKNSGATNAYRILGAKYGILVLFLDALKGYIPLFLASLAGIDGKKLIFLGLITILAHTYSCFINFKGGKGVATSLGVFLFLVPKVILILVVIFIIIVGTTRYISLGSVVCAGLLPILVAILPMKNGEMKLPLFIVSFIIGIFVIYRHKNNIKKLRAGKENKFNIKK